MILREDRPKALALSISLSLLSSFVISWLMSVSKMTFPSGGSKPVEIILTLPPTQETTNPKESRPQKTPPKRQEVKKVIKNVPQKQEVRQEPVAPPKEAIPIAEKAQTQITAREETKEDTSNKEKETSQEKPQEEAQVERPQVKRELPTAKKEESKDQMIAYYSQVKAIIERNKRYPEEAKRRGEEGTLVVRLRINSEGRIEDIRIIKSSQSRYLDEETIRMLRSLAKLPPPPKAPLELEIEIDYRLGGG